VLLVRPTKILEVARKNATKRMSDVGIDLSLRGKNKRKEDTRSGTWVEVVDNVKEITKFNVALRASESGGYA